MDPLLDLHGMRGDSKRIFGLPAKYVLPVEFNFAYPVGNTSIPSNESSTLLLFPPSQTLISSLLSGNVPEFAFVGRSNVGKSSLIETLLGNPGIVRTSKLPGCTRSVNYFALLKGKNSNSNSHATYMVDLPGYGFAKVKRDEKARWEAFIQGYLRNRPQSVLRRVYLLVDSRHGMKTSDIDMMKLLDSCALSYQIVLTKADQINQTERKSSLHSVFTEIMTKRMSSVLPFVHVVSSKSGEGRDMTSFY